MSVEKRQSYSLLTKKLKKYALIGLSGIAFLFGKGDVKVPQQGSSEDTPIMQTTTHAKMDVSQKIDYIVENMWEKDAAPDSRRMDNRIGQDSSIRQVADPEKKNRIRQTLTVYASVPLGYELLSKLDVTKMMFTDTLSPQGLQAGGFQPALSSMQMDFEDASQLSTLHHELIHALQAQQESITSKDKLNEIDAFLQQVKYVQQADAMGMPITAEDTADLYDYKKYDGNDIEYIKKSLYPDIYPLYKKDFDRADHYGYLATEHDFKSYAQELGANEADAESFAKALIQEPDEEIRYARTHDGETKTTIQLKPPRKRIVDYFDQDGNLVETIKKSHNSQGHLITEMFDKNGHQTKTITSFWNSDHQIIKIIEESEGHNKKTTRYIDGMLQEDTSSTLQENTTTNSALLNFFQETVSPISSNEKATTNSTGNSPIQPTPRNEISTANDLNLASTVKAKVTDLDPDR